jgi:hypothetical protein
MPSKKVKERLELEYKLDGDLKEIDVFNLAPALTGLGELIQRAHHDLGAEHDVGVNVKPFAQGSFVVEISLFIKQNIPLIPVSAIAIGVALTKTTQILEAIGMIKGKAESLIGAIKKLRGKPHTVEQVSPNEYRYRSNSGEVTVEGPVHTLIQDKSIHIAALNVYSKPAEVHGVTEVETSLRGKPATRMSVNRDEAPIFEQFARGDIPSSEPIEEKISEAITMYLKPKRVSLEGEADNWSFRYGANETLRVDVIRDQEFLEEVKSGHRSLNCDDLIVAQVIHKQKIKGTELIGDARTELLKVTEYRESPKMVQGKFTFEPPKLGG